MSRFCQHCGNELSETDTFCQRCGTNCNPTTSSATPVAPVGQSGFEQNNNNYQQPYQQSQQSMVPEMTTGQWVGTYILCTFFGIISIILCIVWGFTDNNTKTAKKNFCRAMLIINVIGFVLGIIFVSIFFAIVASSGDDIMEFIRDMINS